MPKRNQSGLARLLAVSSKALGNNLIVLANSNRVNLEAMAPEIVWK